MGDNFDSLYIVTGATGSIGKEIAKQLALEGKHLVLACRNGKRADSIRSDIAKETGNDNIRQLHLDLSDINSIHEFTAQLRELRKPVHALINNAGIMCRDYSVNSTGLETTFAVNYIGTAILSSLLLPQIEDCGQILFTTSVTRKLHLNENLGVNEKENEFSQLGTYGRSKCALTHFAMQLAIVCPRLSINCVDPGVVNSNMITMHRWYDPIADLFFRPFISTPRQGAETTIKALALPKTSGNIITRKSVKYEQTQYLANPHHEPLMQATRHFFESIDIKPNF